MGLGFSFCCRSKNQVHAGLQCPEEYIQTLSETTSLKKGQIIHLYKCFCNLAKDSESFPPLRIKKVNFLSLASLQRNPILSILLSSMFGDKKHLNFIDFAQFIGLFQAYSSNLEPSQLELLKRKKLKVIFNMFDRDKNGVISEEDLIFVVHKLFSDIFSSHQIMNLAQIMIAEMDTSNTNQILFSDFCKAWEIFDMERFLITRIPG